MSFITVFTPAYNRKDLLPRLFESLQNQVFRDFEWLIIDDGSTDGTELLIDSLVKQLQFTERCFPIRYFKKKNGGKHTAINLGAKKAQGELFFIADSDDMLPPDALKIVNEEWSKIRDDKSFLGLCGIDADMEGHIIGTGLPSDYIDCPAWDITSVHHVTGDLKEVFRTEIIRSTPFPEITDEKFCPEVLVWFRMARNYKMRFVNRVIYIADYQPNGITASIIKSRMESPVGSMLTYSELINYPLPLKNKIRSAINYWRFRFCLARSHKAKIQRDNIGVPHISVKWILVAPIGFLLHVKDKYLYKKGL